MTHQRSSIRTWALVSVAVTSAFLMWSAWWLITTIASPDWCNRALGAQIVADRANGSVRPEYAVGGCFSLLKQQVDALRSISTDEEDNRAFAHGYNGPSYRRFNYHAKLAKAMERLA